MTSPKIHSTEVRSLLILVLYNSIAGVSLLTAPGRNGACRYALTGYAGSPYKHMT